MQIPINTVNSGVSSGKPQSNLTTNQANKSDPSLFGDRNVGDGNSNGIIDKDDFYNEDGSYNEKYFKFFEEKGLVGQLWEKAKDAVNNLFKESDNDKTIGKAALEEKEQQLEWLKRENIDYTVNDDGSVEYDYEGRHEKISWSENTQVLETFTQEGNTVREILNCDDNSWAMEYENLDGLKQVVSHDKDSNVSIQNYKKNESGEYESTNDFMVAGAINGKIYTGSDIAKLMNDPNADTDSFFKNLNIRVKSIGYIRGGDMIEFEDGTFITKTIIIDDVTIESPKGREKYTRDGKLIEE